MLELSALGLASYAAILLVAFAVRSAAGFGAGLIAIPLLAFILPVSTAVAVGTVLTTLSSTDQVRRDWRLIAWRQFFVMFFYSMIGIAVGLYFLAMLDEEIMKNCLGIFLVLYSLHSLWMADARGTLPRHWHGVLGAVVGIVGGLVSAMFGAGAGPFYVVYFDILKLDKAVFRATMSAVVLLGGAARIAGYASSGFYEPSAVALLAIGIPLVIVGSWLGDRLVYRLSARSFSRLVAALMLLSGIALLIR